VRRDNGKKRSSNKGKGTALKAFLVNRKKKNLFQQVNSAIRQGKGIDHD